MNRRHFLSAIPVSLAAQQRENTFDSVAQRDPGCPAIAAQETFLDKKPNHEIPGCPIPGCVGKTFIIGQYPRLVHCWECACNKCGVVFIHNKYLKVKHPRR